LLDHGHPEAWSYPLGFLWLESTLVSDRVNALAAQQAQLMQLAVSTIPNMSVKSSGTKSMLELFRKTMKMMTGD